MLSVTLACPPTYKSYSSAAASSAGASSAGASSAGASAGGSDAVSAGFSSVVLAFFGVSLTAGLVNNPALSAKPLLSVCRSYLLQIATLGYIWK